MDPLVYRKLIEQEESLWWFRARRAVSWALLNRIQLPANPAILEAGCGSGGNLPMLSRLGDVYGFEPEDAVRNTAQARAIGHVAPGKLPNPIPFEGKNFDLIALFDVLEHTDDDRAALSSLVSRLNPGGSMFLTVPAFQRLFSPHDTLHHHHRRYSRSELMTKIENAGLKVELITYWNFFLFPVAVAVRFASILGLTKNQTPGSKMPPGIVNTMLFWLSSSERYLIPCIRLPFGLSLMVIARKL